MPKARDSFPTFPRKQLAYQVYIEKNYVFGGREGNETLAELVCGKNHTPRTRGASI